jgi:hypothetical protein
MNNVEKISQQTQRLPDEYQTEVLDFVEFLLSKSITKIEKSSRQEEQEWMNFSLSQAMQGIDDEDIPGYTESDLIEKWK